MFSRASMIAFRNGLRSSIPFRPARPTTLFETNTFLRTGPSRRNKSQYNRFQRASDVRNLWSTSPIFRYTAYTAGAGATGYVVLHIETVPGSGRRRFNCVSAETEEFMARQEYYSVLQQAKGRILSPSSPEVRRVKRVMERLIPSSGVQADWEVHVMRSEEANAFVMPGGKVFVMTGILGFCKTDAELAAVLGHEIAHNVAHHAAESMSRAYLLYPIIWAVSFVFDVSSFFPSLLAQLAFQLPGSRAQEREADFLGLMMMAQSCYDPNAAISFWKRMEESGIPQFISTHPSHDHRIAEIQKWLPKAIEKRQDSPECGSTTEYVDDFRRVFGVQRPTEERIPQPKNPKTGWMN